MSVPETTGAESLAESPHPSGAAPRPVPPSPASGEGKAVPDPTGVKSLIGAESITGSPPQTGVALRPGSAPPASGGASQPFFYGGQAVIEGVMMRGKSHYAVVVRLPSTKEIVVDRGELKAPIY